MRNTSQTSPWVLVGGTVVALVVALGLLSQYVGYKPTPDVTPGGRGGSESSSAGGAAAGPSAAVRPAPPARDTSAEELAVAMSRVEAALGQCDRCRAKLDRLAGFVAGWGALTKGIETNDDGRRLAATEVGVRTYLEVANPADGYATDGSLARLRERLRLLEAIPKAAKEGQDRGYLASDTWTADIARLEGDAVREAVKLEQASGLLTSLLDANPKAVPAAPTLAAALATLKKKLFDEKLAVITVKEAEATRAGNERVAEARKLAVETEKKLEAKKALEEAATKEDMAKKEKLRVKAKSDEVRKYLGHFFTESYYQPTKIDTSYPHLAVERTDKKQAVSYTRLVGLGVTADGLKGQYAMNMASGARGSSSSANYDRPLIKAPAEPNDWTNDKHEFLQKACELIKELGPILVEEGLLAP